MTIENLKSMDPHDQFVLARWFYAIGDPIISDAEYTFLLDTNKALTPNDPYVNRSWSSDPCPVELLKSLGLESAIQQIVLSDKTESIESLNTWADVNKVFKSWTGKGTLSYKHDGWNVQASYYNGSLVTINTRGRSSDSMNVDSLRDIIPNNIPAMGSVKVVMECTIPNRSFSFVVQKYGTKDQRASVSTILAHPEDVNYLECTAFAIHGYQCEKCKFEVLKDWGFNIPNYQEVHDYESIVEALNLLSENRDSYSNPTDGVVFDGGFLFAIRLLAWEEPIYKSYVVGYEESFNRYVISPRLKIYPILRGDTTQQFLNVTNWQRIIDMDLQPGTPVAFRVASSANADVNEGTTLLLHQQYYGKFDQYQKLVEDEEKAKIDARNERLGLNKLDEEAYWRMRNIPV